MIFDEQTLGVIEWVAAALGVINISLLIFRSVWNYPFGIAMVALYVFVFFEKRLYAESGLQIFFILAQLWGWWMWVRAEGDDDRVPVRWLDWKSRAGAPGELPKRPKGSDCKSAVLDFGGSNPSLATER